MDNHFFYQLSEKYVDGTATPEERELVEAFYEQLSSEDSRISPEMKQRVKAAMDQQITAAIRVEKSSVRRIYHWPGVAAAAAILAAVVTISVLLLHRHSSNEIAAVPAKTALADIAPGGNKAILTLAGGSTIILDSAQNGTLASQGNAKITKLSDGRLAYNTVKEKPGSKPAGIFYNTLSTPRGGQYQLSLPDGSKVWLNSASSITYPTGFTGNAREVTVTGEAYFEVIHNSKMPFRVKAGNQTIEDLGTHFNINAYSDEPAMKTTLLEGSVRIDGTILKPGQQAILKAGDKLTVLNKVDLDKVMAWKNGWFEFENTDLSAIMRQVSRWYDVDIRYEKQPGSEEFGGRISRNLPLSKVLQMLEANGVKFNLDGKELKVKP